MDKIYLDHAATSPMHPDVVDKMIPYMTKIFGNPSSIHHFGRQSRHALDEARQSIADAIGAKASEVIFTSGGTEADNLGIIGVALANREKGNHIITTAIEHHAVLHSCKYLESLGFEITYLPVNEEGHVSLDEFKSSLRPNTILVSIMLGNNEVGSIQPISEIGSLVAEHQAYLHTDAVQAFGVVPINVNELKIDLLSVSGHKINGPKGTGFLYIREGSRMVPNLYGGEQERKRRAGTENVPGIVGLSNAVVLAAENFEKKKLEYVEFKYKFVDVLKQQDIEFSVNGQLDGGLPHILNIYFPGTNVESMLVNLDIAGISASSGSACTAGSIDPSHVLVAMYGKTSERIASSIRFSFGYGNTMEQVERAAVETARIVRRLTK
ncbi:cysteine desulfurase [Bacillus luteolus]|uniref:cysteine desulfurase n=1 Tax=Litchfieldia luteola TaxID=682179 RepID=A0ABR9QHW8_9BACI|nr:cysteine desulfurase family protein [Cytobacillus luteolus]MBE4908092.1 cysteine desulfurase [Cytobacillus luteolus]MBP1942877.1 cysteine desulfurase [Cytobacillus luteolus]